MVGMITAADYELIKRLRDHVGSRGGTQINGAWQMMLDAADALERVLEANKCPFDNPNFDIELDTPCPVCGDLGFIPSDYEEQPVSRCIGD